MKHSLLLTTLAAIASPLSAQIVHYPDSTQANPPEFGFPFYTPGAGSTGATVRTQFYCPDSFLQNAGQTAGYVTHVGMSIAGAALYSKFEVRAGTTSELALGTDWTVNLPDQRIQYDLSGQMVVGGGTQASPVCEWVDFPLAFPFYWAPGDNLVLDLTTEVGVPGEIVGTTTGGGLVERAYNFSYTAGAPATSLNSNGLKMRFTFAPPQMVEFGSGCSSPGNAAPDLGSIGTPQVGMPLVITADNIIPNGLGLFVIGFSMTENVGGAPLPVSLGGGCDLLVAADYIDAQVLPSAGLAAFQFHIPNNPNLEGEVLYAQYAQYDAGSPAALPYVLSEGGIVSIYN